MKKNERIQKFKNAWFIILDPLLLTITFFLPFCFDYLEEKNELWSGELLFGIQIFATLVMLIISIRKTVRDYMQRKNHRKSERSRMILSHINLLFDLKAELIRDSTYRPFESSNNLPLFYNVHGYIRDVCKNLRDTVAAIIEAETEYVDVALIYKHRDTDDWKWIVGKSGTSSAKTLNEFVKEPTLFRHIIESKQIVFENEKEDCKFYLPKRRDNFFNNKGSVMAMPLTYFNNRDGLIDFVLVISTYGVRFVESKDVVSINEFREILIYEILPYYISLLQTAFGEMHLRHIYNKKIDGNKEVCSQPRE